MSALGLTWVKSKHWQGYIPFYTFLFIQVVGRIQPIAALALRSPSCWLSADGRSHLLGATHSLGLRPPSSIINVNDRQEFICSKSFLLLSPVSLQTGKFLSNTYVIEPTCIIHLGNLPF